MATPVNRSDVAVILGQLRLDVVQTEALLVKDTAMATQFASLFPPLNLDTTTVKDNVRWANDVVALLEHTPICNCLSQLYVFNRFVMSKISSVRSDTAFKIWKDVLNVSL